MPRNRVDFGGLAASSGGDRTGWLGRRDSNLCISESKFANPLKIRTNIAAIKRTFVALRRFRACTGAAPVSEIFHARLCRKPATIFARNDWLSRANRASLLRHG
jgi:hypothetical protein